MGVCQHIPSNTGIDSRKCVVDWWESQLYVKEKTNRNDNPQIDVYFKNLGFNTTKYYWTHKMWCAAFVSNGYLACGIKLPFKNSLAPAVFNWNNAKAFHISKLDAKPGDVVTYTWGSHIEGIKEWIPNPKYPFFTPIGGNTKPPKGVEGTQGVWQKNRLKVEVRNVISLIK
ncbi:hypothetical protein GCM10011514_06550 [Emticicia aquatilis]|uniref:Uncharacterized protein n=1 Tax=Emticicia aquatilis TaxID=1537369 RepID=A0A916YGZ2_9BACT|nr:hypothetical protein [Emticicia aquatilis]GGD45178.1 hypothetical protein GCM10011514_06550 [Emticicia aquatilis]